MAKREALPLDHPAHKVMVLDQQIARARDALKQAERDVSQWQEAIDDWRAASGREVYNASRRKKRAQPNLDLSTLTDAEKSQRKQD